MPTDSSQDQAVIERYRAKYKLHDAIFHLLDYTAHPFGARRYNHTPVDKALIKRVLIANGGHIGDVVISTALLPLLQDAIPGVSIGFLTGTYSKKVLEKHPCISKLHLIDHWYLTRSKQNRLRSYWNYHLQTQNIIQELKAENYDLAIDLRAWFPNFVSILHAARIPIRIGYDRTGGGPLLTHPYKYKYDRRHELSHQLDLLAPLGVDPDLLERAWPCLPDTTPETSIRVSALLDEHKKVCILHPASSNPTRDWPQQNWIMLAKYLVDQGMVPAITGNGERDSAIAEEISSAVPHVINLCNALSWEDLIGVIRRATIVYSVETSIGHIASALGRPVISINGGMADPRHWAPLGATVVSNQISCFPCFDKNGCSHRSCLTDITVEQVRNLCRPKPPGTNSEPAREPDLVRMNLREPGAQGTR